MTDPKEKKPPIQTRTPGRLGGMFDRVKLPHQRHPIEEILAGVSTPGSSTAPGTSTTPGSTTAPGTSSAPGTLSAPGEQSAPGTSFTPRSQPALGRKTAPRSRIAPGGKGAVAAPAVPAGDVSPRRDFTKTPNSILRDVLSRGLFRGKSRDIYDYLYSKTRGAIVPSRSAQLTTAEIMRGANIGSDHTLRDNLRHLKLVGLVEWAVNSGAQSGNEYFVYLPEEANLPFDREGNPLPVNNPPQVSSPPQADSPGHLGQKLPGAPGAETAGGAGGVSAAGSVTSEQPKTSFKTEDEKTDDEAFAGLITLLKQATGEVTGKDCSPAEAERWTELGELLVAELKQAAARTTVSSAPAFLAEHLRRRLSRQPAPQPGAKAAAPVPGAPARAPEPATDDELIEMFTGFLHQGLTVEELDGQLSASVDSKRWPRIRQAALERYERGHVGRPSDSEA